MLIYVVLLLISSIPLFSGILALISYMPEISNLDNVSCRKFSTLCNHLFNDLYLSNENLLLFVFMFSTYLWNKILNFLIHYRAISG